MVGKPRQGASASRRVLRKIVSNSLISTAGTGYVTASYSATFTKKWRNCSLQVSASAATCTTLAISPFLVLYVLPVQPVMAVAGCYNMWNVADPIKIFYSVAQEGEHRHASKLNTPPFYYQFSFLPYC